MYKFSVKKEFTSGISRQQLVKSTYFHFWKLNFVKICYYFAMIELEKCKNCFDIDSINITHESAREVFIFYYSSFFYNKEQTHTYFINVI